jgi:transcriptional regulator with XRE-family HTH domain
MTTTTAAGGSPGAPGSTVPRRQLGRYLRQLRDAANITVKKAADELEWSPVKIWRIESGQTSMRSLDVETMCRKYGASDEMTQALMGLAKETKARGWWHSYGDTIPEWFELYIGLESAASRLRKYEPELIPGLLQTAAYTTEVFRVGIPDKPPAEVERSVAVRLGRQALLTRQLPPAPRLDVVLHESALRHRLKNPETMTAQLGKINDTSRLANVAVRVLPLDAGIHRAALAGGPFTILEFPPNGRSSEPSIVYSDGLTGALYLDKPSEVAAYDDVWQSIQALSLSEARSRELIRAIAKEYETR